MASDGFRDGLEFGMGLVVGIVTVLVIVMSLQAGINVVTGAVSDECDSHEVWVDVTADGTPVYVVGETEQAWFCQFLAEDDERDRETRVMGR